MRLAGHVASMVERRKVYRFLEGDLRERDHLGDGGVDGRIILRWIFKKWDVAVWTGLTLAQEVAGTGECGNEPSGSVK